MYYVGCQFEYPKLFLATYGERRSQWSLSHSIVKRGNHFAQYLGSVLYSRNCIVMRKVKPKASAPLNHSGSIWYYILNFRRCNSAGSRVPSFGCCPSCISTVWGWLEKWRWDVSSISSLLEISGWYQRTSLALPSCMETPGYNFLDKIDNKKSSEHLIG